MKNGKSSLGMARFALYFVASMIAIIPISSVAWGYIVANQDTEETPSIVTQDTTVAPTATPTIATTASVDQLAPTTQVFAPQLVTAPATDPFARRAVKWPFASVSGFGADPMNSFVDKIRDAEDDEAKEKAIEQAEAALEKHYDKYIQGFEKQVDEMEKRLDALRAQLDKRKAAKDRLVGLKLEMLTSQADGLGWPEGQSRAPFPGLRSNSQTRWRTNPLQGQSRLAVPPTSSYVPLPTVASRPPAARQIASLPPGVMPPSTPLMLPKVTQRPTLVEPVRPTLVEPVTPVFPATHNTVMARRQNLSFAGYFGVGIDLLEDGEYGEFLDRYLEPAAFRKSLKSATLDQVSDRFKNDDADTVLGYFQTAIEDPIKRVGPNTTKLTWEVEAEDGSTQTFSLIRTGVDLGKWYIQLETKEK